MANIDIKIIKEDKNLQIQEYENNGMKSYAIYSKKHKIDIADADTKPEALLRYREFGGK